MRSTWLLAVVMGLGCAGTGEPAPEMDAVVVATASQPARSEEAVARKVSPEFLPEDDARWTSTHYNVTIQVDDPSSALAQARALFLKSGATIQSSNRGVDSNGSIAVAMTPEQYAKLAPKLETLPGKVLYESSSSNAMGPQTRQLRDRLALARRAEAMLVAQTKHARGEDLDALLFMHELEMRERSSLEQQIRSYWDQAGKSHVYVTFQRSP